MTQNTLSKSNLWCQELFQGRYLSKMAELFFGNCQRSVKSEKIGAGKVWVAERLEKAI